MFNQKYGRTYQPLPGHKVAEPKQAQAGRRNDEKKIDVQHAKKTGKPHANKLGKSNPGKMMRIPNAQGGKGKPMAGGGGASSGIDEY